MMAFADSAVPPSSSDVVAKVLWPPLAAAATAGAEEIEELAGG